MYVGFYSINYTHYCINTTLTSNIFKADIDVKFHLQWYDEIQKCFREHTIIIFPKYEPMLLQLESLEAVSNTWRIIMDNLCANHYPLQIK